MTKAEELSKKIKAVNEEIRAKFEEQAALTNEYADLKAMEFYDKAMEKIPDHVKERVAANVEKVEK